MTPLSTDHRGPVDPRTYELQSLVPVPHRLTLVGSRDLNKRLALLRGRLLDSGVVAKPLEVLLTRLVRVTTAHGVEFKDSFAGHTRLSATGEYAFRVPLRATAGFYASTTETSQRCSGVALTPGGCLETTIGAADSDPITLSIP